MGDPDTRARYDAATRVKGQPVFGLAVADPIVVYVADDSVNAIEDGPAMETPVGSGRSMYTATAAVSPGTTVRLTTTSHDRPGNISTNQANTTI